MGKSQVHADIADVSVTAALSLRCSHLSCPGECIAEALGMNFAFLCEFEELHSPVRDARSQACTLYLFIHMQAQILCHPF